MIVEPVSGFPGYFVSTNGTVFRALKAVPQKTSKHLTVGLHREKRQFRKRVHRLVLETFVGPCPDGMEALHEDDDPTNNHISNLRWGTRQQNREDMIRNRRLPTKLSVAQVREIRKSRQDGETLASIARRYGVSKSTVSEIARYKKRKYLRDE
jgi:hypothetical protein